MSQAEIKPGKPKVLGVDANYAGLLNIEIPLTPHPDRHWRELFGRGPTGVKVKFPAGHPPRLVGGKVVISPPDSEVEKYLAAAKARIEGTNRNYAERVEPKLRAQKEAEEREKADRKRRIEEAQRLVDNEAA